MKSTLPFALLGVVAVMNSGCSFNNSLLQPSASSTSASPAAANSAPPVAYPAQPTAAAQQPAPANPIAQVGYQTTNRAEQPTAVQPVNHLGYAGQGGMAGHAGFGGYTSPPGCSTCNLRPTPGHQGAHGGQQCTAGCCGTAAPCYPTMPPMSAFGLDPQEFLCDGGDVAPDAMFTQDDRLIGIDLEDTVVKYETARGDIEITPSNRVCVYAPRFGAVRRVNGAITGEQASGPVAYRRLDGPNDILADQPSSAVMRPIGPMRRELAAGPDAMRGRDLGVPIDTVDGPWLAEEVLAALVNLSIMTDGILRDADKPWLAKGNEAALVWSIGVAPQVTIENVVADVISQDQAAEELVLYELPNGKLRVIKVADRHSANVGDIVTFVLRVDNVGEGPIREVELTDNLTTRLEYVPESQTCSKGAVFSTAENDGGSLRLTWKFTDDFKVGEGAIIRFRCRVR